MNRVPMAAILIGFWGWTAVFGGVEDPNLTGRNADLRRQIQEEQIQPLFLSMTSVSSVDLDSLIVSLERLHVPAASKKAAAEPSIPAAEPAAAPAKEAAASQAVSSPEAKAADLKESASQAAGVSAVPGRLEQLDQIEVPIEPMGTADALFRCGQLERAERFYRLASERANSPSEPDWQWAVFQRANCLRHTQPEQAMKLYKELLEKAPGSRWSGAAKAALDILGWYETLRGSSLKGLVSEPNSLSQ